MSPSLPTTFSFSSVTCRPTPSPAALAAQASMTAGSSSESGPKHSLMIVDGGILFSINLAMSTVDKGSS